MFRKYFIFLVIILLFMLLFILLVYVELINWYYLVKIYLLMGNDFVLIQVMNKFGVKGWELVNCMEGDVEIICIYKCREKEQIDYEICEKVFFYIVYIIYWIIFGLLVSFIFCIQCFGF